MSHFYFSEKISPVLATAIHDGHYMREELREISALSTAERTREEDPYTAYLAEVSENRAHCAISRFEVDLNRRRDAAIYRIPEHAWGMNIWKKQPTNEMMESSLKFYDAFYLSLGKHLQRMIAAYGQVVVLDLHTYNHRRKGPYEAFADPKKNPEINIGNINNSTAFRPLLSDFNEFLTNQKILDSYADLGENVKFTGGGMSEWIFQNFPNNVCCISMEFKKTFMDEWTGVANVKHLNSIRELLEKSIHFLTAELEHNIEGIMTDTDNAESNNEY